MKHIFIGALFLLVCVPSFAKSFKVAVGTDGYLHCYNMDASGKVYGYPVDASECHVSYRLAKSVGRLYCFNADSNNTVYGDPVSDSNCTVGYKAAKSIYGYWYCYATDAKGIPFGEPVAESLCNP